MERPMVSPPGGEAQQAEGSAERLSPEAQEAARLAKILARGKEATDMTSRSTALSAIGLSSRLLYVLLGAGITTVGELLDRLEGGEQALLEISGIDSTSAAQILDRLKSSGLHAAPSRQEGTIQDAPPEWAAAEMVAQPRIISVVNRKGGVGKTTTAFNLAGALAQMEREVLLVDMDPMGSLCRSMGIQPGEQTLSNLLLTPNGGVGSLVRPTHIPHMRVVPGDPDLRTFEMKHGTSVGYRVALRDSLAPYIEESPPHFIFIDCPPSLGLISGNALVASHQALVPVDGSAYGMGALQDTLTVIRLVGENINQRLQVMGLLLNNVDLGTVYDRTVLRVLNEQFSGLMFKAVIHTAPEADQSAQIGEPVTRYAPSSSMAKAYWRLAEELLERGETGVK